MALKLLVNSVWGQAARVVATDLSYAETADEQIAILNVVGGPRYLAWQSFTTGDRLITYVNTSGGLSADTLVLARADRHNGHALSVHSWTAWTGTQDSSLFSTSNFNQALIGPKSQDWILEFTQRTGKQAFGLSLAAGTDGAYTKYVHQLYFCNAFSISYFRPPVVIQPSWSVVQLQRQRFLIQESASITLDNLTRAEMATLESLYRHRDDAVFLYDSTGSLFSDKLWHCVIVDMPVSEPYHDLNQVNLTLGRLRHYDAS